MSAAATLTRSPRSDAESGGWARPMLDRQLRMLGDLAEIGLELARAVEAEAKGPEPDLDRAVLSYSRVARAVRQTIMLQARLIEALQAAETGEVEKAKALQARRNSVKDATKRVLRRAIEAEHEAPERIERLVAEAAERLESEAYGDLLTRPIRDIIADICKDLGLDPHWPSLEYAICEAEEAANDEPWKPSDGYDVVWLNEDPPPRPDSS